jgi:hypothetical protein
MPSAPSIASIEALQQLGFGPDAEVKYSDLAPGQSYDFGGFKLTASFHCNLYLRESVSFGGLIVGRNSISQIEFEMPFFVESVEQCAAWIAWHLDHQGASHARAPWLEMGRQHLDTLPWVREAATYAARPQCVVDREWMRLALKKLKRVVAAGDTENLVSFGFDGAVLVIECGKEVIRVPAEGDAWPDSVIITVAEQRALPSRLSREKISVSVFKGKLTIGNRVYAIQQVM